MQSPGLSLAMCVVSVTSGESLGASTLGTIIKTSQKSSKDARRLDGHPGKYLSTGLLFLFLVFLSLKSVLRIRCLRRQGGKDKPVGTLPDPSPDRNYIMVQK